MGFRIENNCAGCPTYCMHCSRGKDYRRYFCDDCGGNADSDTPLYDWDGKELCFDCIKERLNQKILDDMDDSLCENGCETDTLYELDGRWYCEDCLEQILEWRKIDTDGDMD